MIEKKTLIVEKLMFKFSEELPYFFHNVSLSFLPKNIHFIRGKNGSGKSTLFRLICGQAIGDEVIDAHFILDGVEYLYDEPHMISRKYTNNIKMVQQKFDLMLADQFSFRKNLCLANLPEYPYFAPLPDHKPIPKLVDRFGINYDQPAYLLSGGQRQILAILMTLQKPTRVLLLDEPTAALDVKNAQMVMQFLHDLIKTIDLSIVIICHDEELVKKHAQKVIYEIHVDETSNQRTIIPVES